MFSKPFNKFKSIYAFYQVQTCFLVVACHDPGAGNYGAFFSCEKKPCVLLVFLWAQFVCVFIISCVAERAHAQGDNSAIV